MMRLAFFICFSSAHALKINGFVPGANQFHTIQKSTPNTESDATESRTCTDANNRVLNRYDGKEWVTSPEIRKYSVHSNPSDQSKKDCASVDDLLKAIQGGKRVWNNSSSSNEREPSTFIPDGCNIPHRKPVEVDTILSKPSLITVAGDSLTRHMLIGLDLISTGNYYDGGVRHEDNWQNCTCDGQFSESMSCRKLTKLRFNFPSTWQVTHPNSGGPQQNACSEGRQTRICWLQGGPHLKSDFQESLTKFYLPNIKEVSKSYAHCPESLIFFVVGLDAQSRALDKKYPHQSRESAKQFNAKLKKSFAEDDNIHVVDFLGLTEDAQTSDGYHKLTDVNVAKAEIFVSLINAIQSKHNSNK